MALDAQTNWNIEMAQPLRLSHRHRSSSTTSAASSPSLTSTSESAHRKPPTREIPLPPEILAQILTHFPPQLPASQPTLHALTLLSRPWYHATIAHLYNHPHLSGRNFSSFITTICPSKNTHIRFSPLASMVTVLDMSALVHNSSKSLTARILGRLKPNLEVFVAPQASFAVNSFAALSKCVHLRSLDLRLISASISNKQLFQTLRPLENLETLFFPRSSGVADLSLGKGRGEEVYTWPKRLKALHLAGGIDDFFLERHVVNVPKTLETLSIQHCAMVHTNPLLGTLGAIGGRLKSLTIRHPMNRLGTGSLVELLLLCPELTSLRISADYIANDLFELVDQSPHPLQILHLDCSLQADADVGIDASVICAAVDEGRLGDLRSVGVSARLAWDASKSSRRHAEELAEALELGELERPLGVTPGVFVVKD